MTKPKDPNCCLCGAPYERIGNTPAPLSTKGRCCDACAEVEQLAAMKDRLLRPELLDEVVTRKSRTDFVPGSASQNVNDIKG